MELVAQELNPQLPQLFGSFWVSTHVPLHEVSPVLHMHVPPEQLAPLPHVIEDA